MIVALNFTAFNVEWGDDSCQDNVCQRQGDNLRPPDHRGWRQVHLDGEDKILSETFFWDTLYQILEKENASKLESLSLS